MLISAFFKKKMLLFFKLSFIKLTFFFQIHSVSASRIFDFPAFEQLIRFFSLACYFCFDVSTFFLSSAQLF